MNEECILALMQDCFSAGYTMPQYCVDNKIKNPVFVIPSADRWKFIWEIHVQFFHDKKIQPTFAILNGSADELRLSPCTIFDAMIIKELSEIKLDECDKIFFLSTQRLNQPLDKIIYLDELFNQFLIRTYIDIPFAYFLQRHPNIKLFLTNFTIIEDNPIKNTEREKKIIKENVPLSEIIEKIKSDENYISPYHELGYTRQELLDIFSPTETITQPDGSTIFKDNDNPMVQIKNGRRVVPNQPENFKNRIYILGGCSHYGTGAPYDKTIPAYLQKFLNKRHLPYRVENVSQFFTYRYQDIFYNLNTLPLKDDDIVFVFFDNYLSPNLPAFDVSQTFFRPHNYGEIFVDNCHVNERGYKVLAEKFFEFLTKNKFFHGVKFNYPTPPPTPHRYGIPQEFSAGVSNFSANPELEEYKQKLRAKKIPVGAIVMNCNPFTLGHEYLVEYAAKKVKKLFIFVVEEDKSEFKFADRFKLVQEGVKKFSNVEVLPSGKFIISQQTFSGYFNKSELQDVQVDSSQDVEIFAREIAPSLGITIRFVGEEPEDNVTRQYNETMRNILPQYGIEFCEIPRKKIGEDFISAGKVREALKEGDFEKIKKLVPKTTSRFLKENFFVQKKS